MQTFSLDSVIRLEAGMAELVEQIDHPLAEFHTKCWGKDLGQYQKPLSDLDGESSIEDSDRRQFVVSAFVGEEKAKEESSHERAGSTQDEATTEDDEVDDWRELDDIIPGTCTFDMGAMRVGLQRILIRADYIRVFNTVKDYFLGDRLVIKARFAIVTGQPCIGKTIWNWYAIARCLSQSQPIIWLYKTSYYLFVESGVYKLPSNFQQAEFPNVIWVFVDSDGNKEGIPAHLTVHNAANLFVIYTTSPNKKRWSNIHNVVFYKEFIMNPWTRKEVHRAARLVMHQPNFELINDVYDRLGPTPRLCIDKVVENDLLDYEDDVRNALQTQSTAKLEALIRGTRKLTTDFTSHKLCVLRRIDVNDLSARNIDVTPITDHIGSRLALHIRNVKVDEQLAMYKLWATTPSFRGMTGTLFEGYCHGLFQGRIRLKLREMIRLKGGGKKCKPQWHTIYCVITNKELEKQRQEALRRSIEVDIKPFSTYEYHDHELAGLLIQEDVYYIPFKENEVGLDSFIFSGGYLYVLQMSGGQNHKIKDGLFALLDRCGNVPTHDRWRFVFVIPNDGQVLKSPYSENAEVRKLKLFSGMMVTERKETQSALPDEKQKCWKRSLRSGKGDEEGPPSKKPKSTGKQQSAMEEQIAENVSDVMGETSMGR